MTFVASWLQNDGTSQLVCSKISSPFSPLICGAANFPVDGGEQIVDVGRAELSVDLQPAVETL